MSLPQLRLTLTVLLFVAAGLVYAAGQEPPDTNYDESKVTEYALPDPLVCFDGRSVTSPKMWRETRRPEILRAFATNIYGRTPEYVTHPRFEITGIEPRALGGPATRKQVTIRLFAETNAPWIDLLLFLPNHKPKPSPVFLGLSYGNQGVHSDPVPRPVVASRVGITSTNPMRNR